MISNNSIAKKDDEKSLLAYNRISFFTILSLIDYMPSSSASSSTKPPVILVDASSYLFRAFHALPPLINSKGQATGAIYGVINMMKKLLDQYQPTYLAMIFDAKGKTFRSEIYPEYKAHRPPMPDELRSQIEPLHNMIKSMGVPLIAEMGVEADDVIGTLATSLGEKGYEVLISTGDKDLTQLVTKHITLINTMNQQFMTPESVEEKFGVRPDQIIDYLALVGDTSDNVPGVPKVGPKTASRWLQQYQTLDNLLQNAEQIKGKVGENLRNNLEQLAISKDLVTIRHQLDLPETLDDLKLGSAQTEQLIDYCKILEFKSWLKELSSSSSIAGTNNTNSNSQTTHTTDEKFSNHPEIDRSQYEIVLDENSFNQWLECIRSAKISAFDTETTDLDAMKARLVGLSLCVEAGKACYIPLAHQYLDAPEQLDKQWVLQQLKPWLESSEHRKVGQNLKYDMKVLANEGISLNGIYEDTMLESYVVNSIIGRHDMNSLALRHLNHVCISFEDVAGKGKKQLRFDEIALEQAGPYAAEDADITLRLHHVLQPLVEEHASIQKLYRTIEMPLVPLLAQIERNGVLIDANALGLQSQQIGKRLTELEREAYEIAGKEFNLGSPKQLQQILFEELGIPVIKKTPKGQPSTAEEVLHELALDYPLPKLLLEYRSLSKLKSTYTDKLPLQINPATGRVHTSYHQAITATGRLSSSDPNLQNIPIRTEEGRRIRHAFIAPQGYKLIAADYSQVELRIMAHLSQDEGLLTAFSKGEDVHTATAAEVFDIPPEEVSTEQRRHAKAINFGLIYGMSAFGLAKQLGIQRDEAQHYIHRYFARYPGVEAYMENIKIQAREQGFVETLMGRRLYLPQINARNGLHRQAAERTAINAPMQGTAADIIKLAMLNIDNWIKQEKLPLKVIMQVHDELVFEVPESQANELAEQIKTKMSQAVELSVPLIVEAGIGDNWQEAH